MTSPIFQAPDSVWVADPSEGDVTMDQNRTVTVSWTLVPLPPIGTDTDSDGLDDRWELLHLGTLARGPTDDPDGDAATNADEQTAGSDPRCASYTRSVSR